MKKKDSQIKGESHLNSLSEAMDFMTNKFEEYELERQEKDKIINTMKSDMVNMNEKIEKLERIVDRQEQYSRCNCLLLHGTAEGKRENTDELVLETLNEKMYIDLTPADLDGTHRIGPKKISSNKPRAVIIKFVSYNTRKNIFSNKKLLKGTQVSITESLTAKRMGILKEARESTNFATCGLQMVKYCTKMETTTKLNFTMIKLTLTWLRTLPENGRKKQGYMVIKFFWFY